MPVDRQKSQLASTARGAGSMMTILNDYAMRAQCDYIPALSSPNPRRAWSAAHTIV